MPDNTWNLIASELLVNLASGWFGAVLITPNYSHKKKWEKIWILTVDIALAIFCIAGAYFLRSNL